jgi:metal-responsive CopG/Arc/MetJ family transcriptional regulator
MTHVKTAISLPKPLFDEVASLAKELKIPRSRLFALALEEYIRRHHNHRLLDQINVAYDDEPDADERACLQIMRRRHRQIVEVGW